MMTCDKAKALLSDYIDGTLEPGVRDEVDAFLKSDPECNELFEEALSIHNKLTNMPQVSPSEDFSSNLRNEIVKLNNDKRAPAFNKKGLSLVFSGTVLVASLYLFIFTDIGTQQNIQEGPIPSSTLSSPSAGFQTKESTNDKLVETKDDEIESDTLKNVPEKINTDNLHLTGDK